VGTLPVRSLTRLARQLENVNAHATAARLLRRAQQKYPADFWVNLDLASVLKRAARGTPQRPDELREQAVLPWRGEFSRE
jgi:hypothetical protein